MESIKPTMFEPAAANIVAGWVTERKAQLCKEKKRKPFVRPFPLCSSDCNAALVLLDWNSLQVLNSTSVLLPRMPVVGNVAPRTEMAVKSLSQSCELLEILSGNLLNY